MFYGHYLSAIRLDPADPRRIFAAGDLGIEETLDGGRTWHLVLRLTTTDLGWGPGTPRELLAGVESEGVEVSQDYGRTLHEISGGLPHHSPLIGRVALAVAPSDPATMYVSMATLSHRYSECLMGLYVTHDGGLTFARLRHRPDFLREPAAAPPQAQGDYDQVLVAARSAGALRRRRRAPGQRERRRDLDRLTQTFYLHIDQHALLFTAQGLYIGDDGGVYRLTPGDTLQDLNTNLSITEVYPALAVRPRATGCSLASRTTARPSSACARAAGRP